MAGDDLIFISLIGWLILGPGTGLLLLIAGQRGIGLGFLLGWGGTVCLLITGAWQ